MCSLNEENFYDIDEVESNDEIEEVRVVDFEIRYLKQVIKESRQECRQEDGKVGSLSQPSNAMIKHRPIHHLCVRK